MSKLDYYQILGISKNASDRDIKIAYKKLAIKYHPDKNPGNKESELKFKNIKEAYDVLINADKRNLYDKYGHSAFNQENNTSESFTYSFSSGFGDIFSDIFGDIFSNDKTKKHSYNKKNENLYYTLEIDFEESIKGTKKNIDISFIGECNYCNGTGSKNLNKYILCTTCKGSGKISTRQGFFLIQQTCNTCYGNKKIIKDPCVKCNGTGNTNINKTINISIPSGINNNDEIKISSQNLKIISKNYNFLCIKILVKNNSIFNREKDDLYCNVPINFTTAALGGEIYIPILNGKVKLKIPKETQTGKILRIKGKGVYNSRSYNQGDLFCKIVVETPINLNDYQKKLLQDLNNSICEFKKNENNPMFKNFIKNLKKFFDV